MMGYLGVRTRKALKAKVGQAPAFWETSAFGQEYVGDGEYCVVGPTPHDRKWYAKVTVKMA
jgi:hypothetical protein